MSISNAFGMDGWNSYSNWFSGQAGGTTCYVSNYITVQLTNELGNGPAIIRLTNVIDQSSNFSPFGKPFPWPPWLGGFQDTNSLITFFSNTVTSLPPGYFSESSQGFVFFTNALITSNSFLPNDRIQRTWPVHSWVLNITNHLFYALFDGSPTLGGALLDFVNLGPFGCSTNISQAVTLAAGSGGFGMSGSGPAYWATGTANNGMPLGMANQLMNSTITPQNNQTYLNNLNGIGTDTSLKCSSGSTFAPPLNPSTVTYQTEIWVANDPLVHYTIDDLTWPGRTDDDNTIFGYPVPLTTASYPVKGVPFYTVSNNVGRVSSRYSPWGAQDTIGPNMLFKDPLMNGSTNWAFPTYKFPGVGWLGRVHRGTPWQTVYLKADSTTNALTSRQQWVGSWVTSPWFGLPYEAAPESYPTSDWALVDLFTTAPNDNAARGLLSVNQTNDAAWAAVFAGVIAPTNANGGVQIMPNNYLGVNYNFTNLMDGPYGISAQRTNYPNGIFHKIGDILAAPALTTQSPFLVGNAAQYSDEIVERIPQQTLSLLKVGEPQFVIFAWGQSLKPKGPPYLGGGPNNNMYTNYEITGESLTRTVCHLVHTNGVKMVIDSYNVESGNP